MKGGISKNGKLIKVEFVGDRDKKSKGKNSIDHPSQ
jgi:hypothetical protein